MKRRLSKLGVPLDAQQTDLNNIQAMVENAKQSLSDDEICNIKGKIALQRVTG